MQDTTDNHSPRLLQTHGTLLHQEQHSRKRELPLLPQLQLNRPLKLPRQLMLPQEIPLTLKRPLTSREKLEMQDKTKLRMMYTINNGLLDLISLTGLKPQRIQEKLLKLDLLIQIKLFNNNKLLSQLTFHPPMLLKKSMLSKPLTRTLLPLLLGLIKLETKSSHLEIQEDGDSSGQLVLCLKIQMRLLLPRTNLCKTQIVLSKPSNLAKVN